MLQHPHTTVKVRTWLNAWKGLENTLPSVKKYAGSGKYYEDTSNWDCLDKVRENIKNIPSIDFILK